MESGKRKMVVESLDGLFTSVKSIRYSNLDKMNQINKNKISRSSLIEKKLELSYKDIEFTEVNFSKSIFFQNLNKKKIQYYGTTRACFTV